MNSIPIKAIFYLTLLLFISAEDALGQSCLPDGITFHNQVEVDNFKMNYPGCKIIEGDVIINDTNINNLDSLFNITTIDGQFYLNDNPTIDLTGLKNLTSINGGLTIKDDGLVNFKGLENLKIITGDVLINDNPKIVNFEGLSALKEINGSLTITENNIKNLDGLDSLKVIKGSLTIDDNTLLDIQGLSSLAQINGLLYLRDNDNLKSIKGIDKLDPTSIQKLFITNSDSLSFCSVKSICTYITQNLGPVTIDLNSVGCNTEMEITDLCATTSSNELIKENTFLFFPNPAHAVIHMQTDITEQAKLYVIDNSGKIVMNIESGTNVLDVSGLPSGYYLFKMISERKVEHHPFIKL